MNGTLESTLRFVNLTASGLLAGSLGFGSAALVPGWEEERARHPGTLKMEPEGAGYANAIGPVALASAITLAIGARNQPAARRILDSLASLGLTGVMALTMLVTVPIGKELDTSAPKDYPSHESRSKARNFSRAHSLRTALGVGAFVCAVASSLGASKK